MLLKVRQIDIESHRKGLLAVVGHDLDITFTEIQASLNENGHIEAEIGTNTLAEIHEINPGKLSKPLSESDKKVITDKVHETLQTESFPAIRFSADAPPDFHGGTLSGTLEIAGITHSVTLRIEENGDAYECYTRVKMSDFKLKPVVALGGAIKMQDEVDIRFHLELDKQAA